MLHCSDHDDLPSSGARLVIGDRQGVTMLCDVRRRVAEPWIEPILDCVPDVTLFDCHTHVGVNDPSGFPATPEELIESLEIIDRRAAVFPLKEPDGYGKPNLREIRLAQEHPGRLVAFCRIDPADTPLERAEDALRSGARGIKLHPASDEFDIGDPRLHGVYGLAHEAQLPVIVHAGPEVDGVGETALDLCRRFPRMRLILAHDALTDRSMGARPAARAGVGDAAGRPRVRAAGRGSRQRAECVRVARADRALAEAEDGTTAH